MVVGPGPPATLQRGFVLIRDEGGRPVTSRTAARTLPSLRVELRDGPVVTNRESGGTGTMNDELDCGNSNANYRVLKETADWLSGQTGPLRPRRICDTSAVATGLRFVEIASTEPGLFQLASDRARVTVVAAYTKSQSATRPLPDELAADLAPYLATIPAGSPTFPLPDKGAAMLRRDLEAAGIPTATPAGGSSTSTPCGASAPLWPTRRGSRPASSST
jgi:hypothetical protein